MNQGYKGYIGGYIGDFMENQKEKKMEHEMEPREYIGIIRGYVGVIPG